ncbi:CD151 antigen-like [Oppia nitens]|uniref:CD151 antigen-like n=1 Tax=Oppia nitens TaxID=1686743 RepID=UPI0023DA4F42|nr:CD151 antigen-like [Oppia nitens]
MALSCGAKCAKLLLIIFNSVFWASGVVLFALGIFFLVEDERSSLFKLFVVEKYNYALLQMLAWAFIVIGSGIALIGFCGCCGAVKENRWILIIYSLFLMVIFAMELTVGVLAIIFQEKVVAELKLELTNKLQTDYGLHSSFTAAIDLAQTKFECCGIDGPKDYDRSVWKTTRMNGMNSNVSRTCCLLQNKLEPQAHNNPRPVNEAYCQSSDQVENRIFRHQNGCLHKLERFIRAESMVFVVMGCGLSGVVLIGIIVSICLCRAIHPNTED